MIVIDPNMLSEALRELQRRSMVNLITGQVKWSDIIKSIRKHGISNAQLAKRLNVSRATVHRWDNGSQPRAFDLACRILIIYHNAKLSNNSC